MATVAAVGGKAAVDDGEGEGAGLGKNEE